MIKRLDTVRTTFDTIAGLSAESSFDFYLTGSRANPCQSPFEGESDWDFFTEYGKEVISFLFILGFKRLNSRYIPNIPENVAIGQGLVNVFQWQPSVEYYEEQEDRTPEYSDVVQVQLIHSSKFDKKIDTQKRLSKLPLFYTFSKEARAAIWHDYMTR